MIRIKSLIGTLVTAVALLGLSAPAAEAARPEPFTIIESIDFVAETFEFTASDPLCPSGTFEDEITSFGGNPDTTGKQNLLIRTVYTCDDGSGTFNAQKHVFPTLNEDGSSTNSGAITFNGGTGDYTRLSGHGTDSGTGDAEGIAVGNISGVLKLR